MNMSDVIELKEIEHHKQLELCKNRPAYRQGRRLTAVKVYTVNNESQHLFIYGVPKINLRNELKSLCVKYGQLTKIHQVVEYRTEIFTECYHAVYKKIQSARIAKRLLDNKSFYGGILHVCYAPEFETPEETKYKLLQRNYDVLSRLNPNFPANINRRSLRNNVTEMNNRYNQASISKHICGPETQEQYNNCLQEFPLDNNEYNKANEEIDSRNNSNSIEDTEKTVNEDTFSLNVGVTEPPIKKIKLTVEKRIIFRNKSLA